MLSLPPPKSNQAKLLRRHFCPEFHCHLNGHLRWKSQRIQIHRLGYRFSKDCLIRTLGSGFLFGNHMHLAKSLRLLVCGFLKSTGRYGFSYGFLVVLNVFHQCFLLLIFHCFLKDDLHNHFCIIRWCLVSLGNPLARHPMDLKIYSLERNTRP